MTSDDILAQRIAKAYRFVRTAAYYIWEKRVKSGEPGDHLSDWAQADRWVRETYPYVFMVNLSYSHEVVCLIDPSQQIINCPTPTCGAEIGERGKPFPASLTECPICGVCIIVTNSERVST